MKTAKSRASRRLRARVLTTVTTVACLVLPLVVATGNPQSARADSGLGVANWWQHLSGEKTINVRADGSTLNYVKGQLATYQSNGYHILNIDWPVKSGPLSIYNGFSASDFMHVDPSIGTDQEWLDLLTAAHARGMAVISWFNPSYFWTGSALFKQAEADVKTYGPVRANQPANSPARFFQWQTGAGAVSKPCDSCGGSYGSGRWVTDPDASASGTTVSYNSAWSDQPTGDFASPEWRTAIAGYLQHWLDTGIDGFIFDAPLTYINCDAACVKSYVINVVHGYSNRLAASETPRSSTSVDGGMDATTDDAFWNTKIATNAIATQNPSGIEDGLANRDGIVTAGGTDYGAPDFTTTGDAGSHLLQAATIAASGNYLAIWDPGTGFGTLDSWAGEGADFAKITNAVTNNPVLQTQGARDRATTNNDNAYYSFVRTTPNGAQKAVVILNYTTSSATITATVSPEGVADGATTDLLNGGPGPSVSSGQVTVTLPAHGYAFLQVPVAACVTNLCTSNSATPGTTTLSTVGSVDWVHWGSTNATSVDRKNGANILGSLNRIGTSPTYRYANALVGYSWTGGTPTSSATNSATGLFTTGIGNGFSLTAPADTSPRTLQVEVGAYQGRGKLTAILSDGSAANVIDTSPRDPNDATNRVMMIQYRANSASQTLTVNYVLDAAYQSNANVTFQSATLSVPTATVVDDNSTGWTYGGGWFGYSDPLAYSGTAHGNAGTGGYGTLTFTGSRVEVYVWKESGAGNLAVYVDGVLQGTRTEDNGGAEAYNQLLVSASWPTSGAHTVKVLATNANWTMVDYAKVYS